MDTPRSASPFSTPAAELDDHRFQPHSLPRSNTFSSDRYSTDSMTTDNHLRPDMRYLTSANRPVSRGEHEFAIVSDDDDAHTHVSQRGEIDSRPMMERRGSTGRSGTAAGRRSRSSSRSPSPPNSVDAFAAPEQRQRKERSATVTSQVPSELGLGLRRTLSHRQTFSDTGVEAGDSNDEASQKAEEDVCFPLPDESGLFDGIHFDEMEEFVEEQLRGRAGKTQRRRKTSICDSVPSRYFDGHTGAKNVVDQPVTKEACGSTSTLTEKVTMQEQRPSNPDRFSFFSSEMDATIHAPEIGDLLMDGETFHDLFRGGRSVWWLDCLNATTEELSMLMKAFVIHPLTAEDIRVQEPREKVELFKSYYFVCFRSFVQSPDAEDFMEPINVYLIVFRSGVLSFHFRQSPHSANVRRRIRQLRDYVLLSSDWICYAIIDDIVDSFGPVINDIERDSDAIEDAVFVARIGDYTALLKRIGDCRKKTMGSMRLLGSKADVIKGFAKRCNEQYHVTPRGDIGLYLGDIQDHIVTMMGNLQHFEKMLSRSHSNYLAQLSVDTTQASNRANEVLSKITTLATILVPLNLITGLFGMNVPVPGRSTTSLAWFFGIVGTIFLFVTIMLYSARRWRFI